MQLPRQEEIDRPPLLAHVIVVEVWKYSIRLPTKRAQATFKDVHGCGPGCRDGISEGERPFGEIRGNTHIVGRLIACPVGVVRPWPHVRATDSSEPVSNAGIERREF